MDDTSKKPQTFRALAAELKLPRKLLYTLDEVSRVLGVPYNTLRDECTARRLTYCLPDGRCRGYMVRPEWVDEWIEEGTHERDSFAA